MARGLKPKDFDSLLERLGKPPGRAYLLVGPEAALRERAERELVARLTPQNFPEFNLSVFSGAGIAWDEVLKAASTYPAFAERRVVVLREPDLAAAARHTGFVALMGAIPDTTSLVASAASLPAERGRAKAGSGLGEVLAGFGKPLEFPALSTADARAWLERLAGERSARLEPAAGELLLELVGTDLARLEAELEKAHVYALGTGAVTGLDVEAVTTRTREHSVWDLTDAVVRSDLARALGELGTLIDDGAEVLGLLGVLAFKLRQLLEGSLLVKEKASASAIGGRLRLGGPELSAFIATAKRSDPRRLARALAALKDADDRFKSTAVDGRVLLEQTLVELAR